MSISTLTAGQVSPVKDGVINWSKNARALEALAELKELKAIEKAGVEAAARRKTIVAPILLEELNGAEEAVIRGIKAVKVQHSSNGKVDSKTLAAAWPEAYAATFTSTPYSFIKVL